jgi:hypothetical protein
VLPVAPQFSSTVTVRSTCVPVGFSLAVPMRSSRVFAVAPQSFFTEGADELELKRQFKQLASEMHPDRNPDSEEALARFQELSAEYSRLLSACRTPQQRDALADIMLVGLAAALALIASDPMVTAVVVTTFAAWLAVDGAQTQLQPAVVRRLTAALESLADKTSGGSLLLREQGSEEMEAHAAQLGAQQSIEAAVSAVEGLAASRLWLSLRLALLKAQEAVRTAAMRAKALPQADVDGFSTDVAAVHPYPVPFEGEAACAQGVLTRLTDRQTAARAHALTQTRVERACVWQRAQLTAALCAAPSVLELDVWAYRGRWVVGAPAHGTYEDLDSFGLPVPLPPPLVDGPLASCLTPLPAELSVLLPTLGRELLADYGDAQTLLRLHIFHTPQSGWTYPGPFATPIDLGLPTAGDYVGPLFTSELLEMCAAPAGAWRGTAGADGTVG